MLAFILALPHVLIADGNLPTDRLTSRGLEFLLFAVVVIAVYSVLYIRATPRAFHALPKYIHEPPSDLPPALVGMLFDTTPTSDKMAATVLDLVRRGVIEMQTPDQTTGLGIRLSRDDRLLLLHRERTAGLQQFEQEFIYEVFDHIGAGDRVRLKDVRAWWRAHPATSGCVEAIWSVRLHQAMMLRGLLDARALKMKQILTLYGVAVVFGILLAGYFGVWAVLSFSLGLLLVMWSQRLTGATQRGTELAARYAAFRRYLADFGRFDDQPAEAVVIWGEYLPLAIALGLGDMAEKEMRVGPLPLDFSTSDASWGNMAYPFPDETQALAYMGFRRAYDPALPTMTVLRGRNTGLVFRPHVETAMSVTGPFGKWIVSMRCRPLAAFVAMSPFLLFPVGMVALVLVFSH